MNDIETIREHLLKPCVGCTDKKPKTREVHCNCAVGHALKALDRIAAEKEDDDV